jgi:hypothetical protein
MLRKNAFRSGPNPSLADWQSAMGPKPDHPKGGLSNRSVAFIFDRILK